jgi:hypothetical protein
MNGSRARRLVTGSELTQLGGGSSVLEGIRLTF